MMKDVNMQKLTQFSSSKKALLAQQVREDNQQLILAEPIAIIGMGCRFPGEINTPTMFWNLIANGGSAISEIPADRWDVDAFYHPDGDMPGKIYTRQGGFLSDLDQFDPSFFSISPREACQIDPQQRLALEVAWDALEQAGQTRNALSGSQTGVFIGNSGSEYSDLQMQDLRLVDAYVGTGSQSCVIANRISYFLNLKGPSLTVDTACSSSLVALHLACQSLRNGESHLALAGGVNLMLMPDMMVAFTKSRILSPDGYCKTFDKDANGYVRSEGCGMIVLKRLADAIVDNDPIQAVITGSAINHDGKTNGLSAPNSLAQAQVIREALAHAMLEPSQVSFVEAHGTGTRVGDTIEFEALNEVYGRCQREAPCFLGAVKTNIGHLEAAAGIAGIIKVVLCLQQKAIPPNLNFQACNPNIDLNHTRFELPLEKRPWHVGAEPRRGAVSSFGFGGSNAHVILEEAPPAALSAQRQTSTPPYILPLSAHSPEALQQLAERYHTHLSALTVPEDTSLADICYTASVRRHHHSFRLAVTGATGDEMAEQLAGLLTQSEAFAGVRPHQDVGRKLAFVFSGQGQQWRAMGRDLLRTHAVFRHHIETCDQLFQPLSGWSILAALQADGAESQLDDTAVAQPAIFALQVGLAEVWRSYGIVPDAVVGHSVGEVAAAHVAGILNLEDALRVIYHRGRLMQQATGLGKMASVRLPAEQIEARLRGYEDCLAVAAINDPASTVVAGAEAILATFLQHLQEQGIHSQVLPVNYAFHSPQMEPFCAELVRELDGLQTRRPGCHIISTVTGRAFAKGDYSATYWGANVRQTVRFAEAIVQLLDQGVSSFVEISAHPVLAGSMAQVVRQGKVDSCIVESLRRQMNPGHTLLGALGKLYAAGHQIDWQRLYPSGRCMALPQYPFQRERYWYDQSSPNGKQPTSHFTRRSGGGAGHPLCHQKISTITPEGQQQCIWECEISAEGFYFPHDHRVRSLIVFPAAGYIDLALSAAREHYGDATVSLEQIEFEQALDLPETGSRTIQLILSAREDGAMAFRIVSHPARDGEQSTSWTQHASGLMRGSQETAPDGADETDTIQARCTEPVSREEHYDAMRREGLNYGPAYQGVEAIWRRDGEALAQLQLTDVATVEGKQCQLHPSVLDACFQALSAATPSAAATGDTYLPVGVGKLTLYRVSSAPLWAHVRLTAGGTDHADDMLGEIDLMDADGNRMAEVRDYRVKRLNPKRHDFLDHLYEMAWIDKPLQTSDLDIQFPSRGSWVLFADRHGVADTLHQLLSAQGESCHMVYRGDDYRQHATNRYDVDPSGVESFQQLFTSIHEQAQTPCRGIVFLWALDEASLAPTDTETDVSEASAHCIRALHMTQALLQGSSNPMPRLWFVTRSAQPIGTAHVAITQAPLWGLARTIALEHPDLNCTVVDLSQADATEMASLFSELTANEIEDQLLLRAKSRYVARLQPVLETDLESARDLTQPASGRPFRLEMDRSGILDHMILREMTRRQPAPGHIEIEVEATGLNFLDVLAALGALPDDAVDTVHQGLQLGAECAGRVAAVGTDVHRFVVGQRVAAIVVDGFATHVTTDARLATAIPDTMSFEEAATIPIVFLTAWQALHHTARLEAGESVLIHAGAGGVGLAALQIAQHLGAEVFATAGSSEKRAFLQSQGVRCVMNSRSLDFAEEVMAYTDGEGVDVVLNSLAGDFIPTSMALLRSYGRFVEIGKRDYYENRKLGLRPFLNNLSFSLVDLRAMMVQRPDHIQLMFDEIMALFDRGVFKPLTHQVFPIARVADAFRFMAQAKHIGKLVIAMGDTNVPVLPPQGLRLHADGSYLISGGLGGLGLQVAAWLAQQGARHLVLIGRRTPSDLQRAAVQAIEQHGASVTVLQGDVSQEEDVLRVLAHVKKRLPSLRGVVHAAGVLDDGMLLNQNAQRFQNVFGPKINGAWYLHRHTQHEALDFFVMFSSTASLTGSPGQANYVAANTFLDVLAHYRHQHDRPGLSINWGPWSEVGMAAAQANRGERLARSGLGSLDPTRALNTMAALLERDQRPQIGVMPVDWELWSQCYPQNAQAPLYSDLLQTTVGAAGADSSAVRDSLLKAPAAEREAHLQDYLLHELAAVLRLPKTQLDGKMSLQDLGVDSLMIIELGNRIRTSLGIEIAPDKIMSGVNMASLASVLLEALPQDTAPSSASSATASALPDNHDNHHTTPTDDLKALSDEQVDALLQQMLDTTSSLFEESDK
jgi:acyl transferase domain-containing protein/acyl carrier protein